MRGNLLQDDSNELPSALTSNSEEDSASVTEKLVITNMVVKDEIDIKVNMTRVENEANFSGIYGIEYEIVGIPESSLSMDFTKSSTSAYDASDLHLYETVTLPLPELAGIYLIQHECLCLSHCLLILFLYNTSTSMPLLIFSPSPDR